MNGRETWLQEDEEDGDGETAYVVHGIRRHTEVIRKNRGQPGNIVGGREGGVGREMLVAGWGLGKGHGWEGRGHGKMIMTGTWGYKNAR